MAVQPPSTKIEVPVIILEESDAKKATAVATSLSSANFPMCIFLSVISCKKDDIYELNEIHANSYNANKNKLKTTNQYISVLYANLFQEALSANELFEISRCIQSIGDKEVAHEIVFSNFMNKNGVIIPSDSVMRDNLDVFIEETYKRFFVRDITEAEREFFISLSTCFWNSSTIFISSI